MTKSHVSAFNGTVVCLVEGCGLVFEPDPDNFRAAGSAFSAHLQYDHKIKAEVYTIEHLYGGSRPVCQQPNCTELTRYCSYTYKRYCKAHASMAMSAGGKSGGVAPCPLKGETKETNAGIAARAERMTGAGNHFYGKHHTPETIEKNRLAHTLTVPVIVERLDERLADWECEMPLGDYVSRQQQYIPFKCKACGNVSMLTFQAFERGSICKTCHPMTTQAQLEIVEFVRSLGFTDVEVSTRAVIAPLELDIWVPSQRVAVEYHGLYWHSGGKAGVVDKHRHRQKYEMCRKAGIRLLQFFSDEWKGNPDVCKSMLRNALNNTQTKLHARDCSVVELTAQQSTDFVNANHVSGATRARYHVGLMHKQLGLVAVATLRKPIQKKYGNVCELARMCFLCDTNVRGGASKLLAHAKVIAARDGFEGLLSYAELRFGEGDVYAQCGLTLMGEVLNNYDYTDGVRRFNRFKFRAQPNKPEKQVAADAGVRPVWGCGNKIYLLRFPTIVTP